MEVALFAGVGVIALYYMVRGFLWSGPGYMSLPTLFSMVILLWVLPQLSAIRTVYPHLSQALVTVYLMTILSMLGTALGWRLGIGWGTRGLRGELPEPNRKVLLGTAIILTAIAGVTALLIEAQGGDIHGMQTGIVTILLFFNNLKIVALFLSLYLALRYRSRTSIVLVAVNLLIYMPLILLYFRRRAIIELAVCLVLSFWFARRSLMPRAIVLAALPLGFVMMFAVRALRTLALDGRNWRFLSLSDLRSVDFRALNPLQDVTLAREMLNAVYFAQLVDQYGVHTWGINTWNRLVFQWVPAQIVGAEIKFGLMFEDSTGGDLAVYFSYVQPTGSTETGIANAYIEFSYFGALFFVAIAYVMGRWWARAHRGDPWAMCFFVGGLAAALISVTHYAFYFFNAMLLYFVMVQASRVSLSALLGLAQRGSFPRHTRPNLRYTR